ncbi:MAG: hypothetical protein ACM3UW_02970 [Bacillota bacterium]
MEKESYDSRIKKLEKALKEASNDRNRALARYDVLQKDLEQIHKRIEDLGCQPEELEARIREIRMEMDSLIKRIEELIPGQYLKKAGW